MMYNPTPAFSQPREVSILVSDERTSEHEENFGLFDKKGREIGIWAGFNTVVLRDFTDEEAAAYNAPYSPDSYETRLAAFANIRVLSQAPGTWYVMRTSAMRAGSGFGPGFNRQWFRTSEERDAALAKYIKGARKRAEKEAAKAQLVS